MDRRVLWLLAVAPLAACGGGADAGSGRGAQASSKEIGAVAYNLYVGFDTEPFTQAADAAALQAAAMQAFQNIQATDYQARVKTIATLIAEQNPELVGLQEAALYRTGPPGAPATTVLQDFLQLLVDELAARGKVYKPVVTVDNIDAQLPMPMGFDLRVTDREAILARQDVRTDNAQGRSFAAAVSLPVPATGTTLKVARGWVSTDATVNGATVHFASTHLETDVAALQEAQGAELLAALATQPLPVLLVGDFNSPADDSGSRTRAAIVGAGYTDAWTATHPPTEPGLTCCQAPDLANPDSELRTRIDYLFARGPEPLSTKVLGDDPALVQSTGRWPSDHAGVGGRFLVK